SSRRWSRRRSRISASIPISRIRRPRRSDVAEFKVPELGENIAGGDVTSVLVKVGDTIAVDQPVLELETDKATVEVPSSVAGRVTDIKVKPGDKVQVGQAILSVEDGAPSGTP